MSKILLIEPDKMLRQAFTVALFPEHQVHAVAAVPDAAPKDFDASIVDAVALQERESLSAGSVRAVEGWKLPTIWIDGEKPAEAPKRDRLVRLKRPVAKALLLEALAQCIGASSGLKPNDAAMAKPINKSVKAKPKALKEASAATSDSGKFIELVDVVEVEPPRESAQPQLSK